MVIVAVVVLGAAAVTAGVALSSSQARRPRSAPRPAPTHRVAVRGALSSGVQPSRPGSLAVGPNGNLYISDLLRDEILERLPDGTFRVVAGNGTVGFSGDGGLATKAQLDNPGGITFGPNGSLYIADNGNGRIRAVSPEGIIKTVAGNGEDTWVTDGTPALTAPLSPTAMTFGPDGLMYVATTNEVLRLDADGTFTRVLGNPNSTEAGSYGVGGPAVDGSADDPDGLAFDKTGNLYVAGFINKTLLMVTPEGTLEDIGSAYPRGDGGLVTAPDGTVLAMDELSVEQLSPQGEQTVVQFPRTSRTTYLGVTGFSPDGIAVAPDGTIYLDTFYGNGFADESAIIAISPEGRASLLWRDAERPTSR